MTIFEKCRSYSYTTYCMVRQVLCHDQVPVLCHDRGDGELCRGACVVARCSCGGGPTLANQAPTDMTRQVVVHTQMTNNRIKALPTTHPELLRRFLYQMIGNFKITTKPNSFQ